LRLTNENSKGFSLQIDLSIFNPKARPLFGLDISSSSVKMVELAEAAKGSYRIERYAIEMESIGCDRDHIHLLCSAHPKLAPGEIVRIFKSITAKEIFRRKPSVKEELWGGEFWTDGYYVATVGERANWDTVENYVKKQGHAGHTLRQLKLF